MVCPRELLLIEDNRGDVYLLRKALQIAAPDVALRVAADGVIALEMLRAGLSPGLVLLDLNLPGLSGHDVLRTLQSDTALAGTPTIVLTSSRAQQDRDDAQAHGALGYWVKPETFTTLRRLAALIGELWDEPPALALAGAALSAEE